MKKTTLLIAAAAAFALSAGPAEAQPTGFTTKIDNPYWPMTPGSRWVYREGAQRVTVTVTSRTKRVASGIKARVVRDRVTEDGKLVEDTLDWYAQDSKGNIWYLGEDTKEYENGKVTTTEGSWEDGRDGARRGLIMPAKPRPGMRYRQEYYKGEAEDQAKVLRLDASVTVPFGSFDNVLKTRDYTRLEPDAAEHKYYVRGVGPVLAISLKSREREELVSFRAGGS